MIAVRNRLRAMLESTDSDRSAHAGIHSRNEKECRTVAGPAFSLLKASLSIWDVPTRGYRRDLRPCIIPADVDARQTTRLPGPSLLRLFQAPVWSPG